MTAPAGAVSVIRMGKSGQPGREERHRLGGAHRGSRSRRHAAGKSGSPYDAPGDPAISIAATLTLDQPFQLDRGLLKRLSRRQIKTSEAFTLRDGNGIWFRAALQQIAADGGVALPYERMERSPEPLTHITLACAVLARQRMHFVMQKATELGVMRIVPLLSEHAVPVNELQQEQPHAWPDHVARAARQCRRGSLPQVLTPMTLDDFLASPLFTAGDLRLYLDDRSAVAPIAPEPPRRLVILVGPEGGFSDGERIKLAASARAWVLGGRVLRAETAAVVALAAAHCAWGDFAEALPDASGQLPV